MGGNTLKIRSKACFYSPMIWESLIKNNKPLPAMNIRVEMTANTRTKPFTVSFHLKESTRKSPVTININGIKDNRFTSLETNIALSI